MSRNRYEPGVLYTPDWVHQHVYNISVKTIKIEIINSTDELKWVKFEGPIKEYVALLDVATRYCLCNPVVTKFREESRKDQTIEISDPNHLSREIKISDPFTQRFHIYNTGSNFSLAERAAIVTAHAPNFEFPQPVDRLLRFETSQLFWDGIKNDPSIRSCVCRY